MGRVRDQEERRLVSPCLLRLLIEPHLRDVPRIRYRTELRVRIMVVLEPCPEIAKAEVVLPVRLRLIGGIPPLINECRHDLFCFAFFHGRILADSVTRLRRNAGSLPAIFPRGDREVIEETCEFNLASRIPDGDTVLYRAPHCVLRLRHSSVRIAAGRML